MRKGVTGKDKVGFACLFLVVVLVSVLVLAVSVDTVVLVSPTNDSWTSNTNDTIGFIFNYTGNATDASCELFIGGEAYGVNAAVFNITDTTMLANHSIADAVNKEWYVNCTNSTTAQSDVWLLNIDTVNPQIDIAYPANISYATALTNFNYTYTEINCGKVWYSNDSGVTNYSVQTCGDNFTGMVVVENSANTWIVYMNDTVGNENLSSVTFTVDTINPVASASCSPSSGVVGSVTCTCSGTDTGGSGINSSLTTADLTPSTTGTYTCSVTDNAGNTDSDAANYTITTSSSSSSTTFTPIYRPSESKLAEGYDISLGKDYQVNFQISGQDHVLKVDSVSTTSATITISSDPITLDINLSETKKVDLDSDGYYDLSVYLKGIRFSKANFILTSISEEIINGDSVVQDDAIEDGEVIQDGVVDDVEVDKERNYMVWIILAIVLIVVLVVVGAVYFKKSRE